MTTAMRARRRRSSTSTRITRWTFGLNKRGRSQTPPRLWWAFALVAVLAWSQVNPDDDTRTDTWSALAATVIAVAVWKWEPAIQRLVRRTRRRR